MPSKKWDWHAYLQQLEWLKWNHTSCFFHSSSHNLIGFQSRLGPAVCRNHCLALHLWQLAARFLQTCNPYNLKVKSRWVYWLGLWPIHRDMGKAFLKENRKLPHATCAFVYTSDTDTTATATSYKSCERTEQQTVFTWTWTSPCLFHLAVGLTIDSRKSTTLTAGIRIRDGTKMKITANVNGLNGCKMFKIQNFSKIHSLTVSSSKPGLGLGLSLS